LVSADNCYHIKTEALSLSFWTNISIVTTEILSIYRGRIMEMDDRTRELVAIGASITANCQPCLRSHVEKAVRYGARPEEVAAAIEIGNRVRKGAAAKMDEVSSSLKIKDAPIAAGVVMEGNGYQFLGP
jgi:AhpD family alkylhydroperoxidase